VYVVRGAHFAPEQKLNAGQYDVYGACSSGHSVGS
jgi:hypothetical protein